jgi:prepilin-type N-terminal cleavage/methylation domain-containing protein
MFIKKLWQILSKNRNVQNQGFTLVELLVVMIIVGLLAGVSAPNLLQQIGKARETEAKNALASIIRAQQAYHLERGQFAGSIPALGTITWSYQGNQQYNPNSPLGIALTTKYYTFSTMTLNAPSGENFAVVVAVANDQKRDGSRHYGGTIGYYQGKYFQALCQSPYNSTFTPSSFLNVWNYFIAYYGGNVECNSPNQEIN